jgi:hypothetical protein
LIAWFLIAASGVVLWRTQYYVDYEVSVLPWLVGKGWQLYGDVVDQHPPLLLWLLSLVGGDPGRPLQAVIVGLHLLTLALTYRAASAAAGAWGGLGAAALGALWLHAFEATHLWFDAALAPLYLVVAEMVVRRGVARHGRPVLSDAALALVLGVLMGVAVLIKQHAGLAAVVVGVWLAALGRDGRRKRLGAFGLGLGVPLLLAVGWLWLQGTLGEAWYWVVQYSLESGYALEAALPVPSGGEWAVLGALYACLAAFGAVVWLRLVPWRTALVMVGLIAAATLPAWPRYGRFHLGAVVPLLAVAGGVGAVLLWQEARKGTAGTRPVAAVGLLAVALSAIAAGAQTWQVLVDWRQLGEPRAPFEGSAEPLRAWVDGVSPRGEPVFTYNLDLLLYRVLEREPPKPLVPQLPWIVGARDMEGEMWRGVERAAPRVVLVSDGWWDGTPAEKRADETWPGITQYREGARFSTVIYPGARPVTVVGLLRDR